MTSEEPPVDEKLLEHLLNATNEEEPANQASVNTDNFDPSKRRPNTTLGLMPIREEGFYSSPKDPKKMSQAELQSEDLRKQPWYAEWYYSQNPRDPRALPPLQAHGRYATQARATPPPSPPPIPVSHSPNTTALTGNGSAEQHSPEGSSGGGVAPLNAAVLSTEVNPQQQGHQQRQNNNKQRIVTQRQPYTFKSEAIQPPSNTTSPSKSVQSGSTPTRFEQQYYASMGLAPSGAMYLPGLDPTGMGGLNVGNGMQFHQYPQPTHQPTGPYAPNSLTPYPHLANPQVPPPMAAYGYMGAPGMPTTAGMWGPNPALMFASQQQFPGASGNMMTGMPGGNSPMQQLQQGGNRGRGRREGKTHNPYSNSSSSPGGGGYGGRGGREGQIGGGDRYENRARRGMGNNVVMTRSPALENFHSSGGLLHWTLEETVGLVQDLCKDQEGSRFIQRRLDSNPTHQEISGLVKEILENPMEIICDVFGNYVVQKILEVCSEEHKLLFAQSLQGNVVSLTLQTYGCRVIQKCVEVFPLVYQDNILAELQGNVPKCIQDQNGNHVIQKCVEVCPDRCNFIIDTFKGRVRQLATHAYGCRVIQCILQHCPQYEDLILEELVPHVEGLVIDQYGNYVVQHILQHCHRVVLNPSAVDERQRRIDNSSDYVKQVVRTLQQNFYAYSLHKFASNVMEKLFFQSSADEKNEILLNLMQPCSDARQLEEAQYLMAVSAPGVPRGGSAPENMPPISFMYCLIKDQYANYVVQKVLDLVTPEQRIDIFHHVMQYSNALRRYTYGKHLIGKISRLANQAMGIVVGDTTSGLPQHQSFPPGSSQVPLDHQSQVVVVPSGERHTPPPQRRVTPPPQALTPPPSSSVPEGEETW